MAKAPNPASVGETLRDSLGMDPGELGLEDDLDIGSDEGGEEGGGEGDEGAEPVSPQRREVDDGLSEPRVSHTPRQQQQPPQQPQRRFPSRSEVQPDARGNLVNSQGQIVAKAGTEARLYQDLHRERQGHEATRRQITDVNSRLARAVEIGEEALRANERFQAQNEQIERLGITPQEQLEGMQLIAQLKANPEETLKRLLTRASASGINIASLGNVAGFDPKALVDVVRNELQKGLHPLQQRSQIEEQRDQQQREAVAARTEVETFFNTNQAARPYVNVFHALLSDPRFSKMSLDEAWARITANLLRNGIDPDNPQPQQRPQNSPQRRSLPAGHRRPGLNSGDEPRSEMAPVDASYDSILRQVMDELEPEFRGV